MYFFLTKTKYFGKKNGKCISMIEIRMWKTRQEFYTITL